MKRLSIVINNFNYAQFLGAAIDSALSQQWADVEVVVVDDGSTDGSHEVLAGYGDRIVAVLQENLGQSTAVNVGFARSTGDVVIFLDSDDMLLPDLARRVMATFAVRPDVVRVQWPMSTVDADGEPDGGLLPPPAYSLPEGDLARHVVRFRNYIWNPTSASAYTRAALERVMPVPAEAYEKGTGPDLYLSENIVFLGPVAALDEPGTLYRVHGDNHSLERRVELGSYARTKIGEMLVGHEQTREVAARESTVPVPADPRAARDWAFAAYRLASLRAEPELHPMPGDRALPVALWGAWSVATNPMYPAKARAKRVGLLLAAGLAPAKLSRRLLERGLLGH